MRYIQISSDGWFRDYRILTTILLIGLAVVGFLAGLLVPKNSYLWSFPTLVIFISITTVLAISSSIFTYIEKIKYVPVASILPFLGLRFAIARESSLNNEVLSASFYIDIILSVSITAASWGLAGGVVGYIAGNLIKDIRSQRKITRKILINRAIITIILTGICVTSFSFVLVNRGLGD